MDHLQRLIAAVLLLVAFQAPAQAAFPATAGSSCYAASFPAAGTPTADSPVACASIIVAYLQGIGVVHSAQVASCTGTSGLVCGWNWAGSPHGEQINVSPASTCPSNSTLSGGSCTCTAPFVQNGANTGCEMPLDPAEAYCADSAGSPVKQAWVSTSMSLTLGKTLCATGGFYNCTATVDTDYCGQGAGGTIICEGTGVSGGSTCTPSPTPTTPTAPDQPGTTFPDPPPPGTCPGTVNGVAVNVPCKSTTSNTTKNTQTDDGAGNTTSKSEQRSTTCNEAGSCTTTVTTTTTVNGGSPSTTTTSTTEGKGTFCAGNPGSKECGDGEGSAFGGTCQASFTCQGDAVQCATAKAVNDQLCKLKEVFEMDSETLALSTAVMNGTHVEHPKDDPRVENLGSFDQTNPFGSACPGDVSFNIASVTMAIPLSQFCAQLQLMGNLLVAFTLLSATMFVIRGVT